jgi:hypothetical protein
MMFINKANEKLFYNSKTTCTVIKGWLLVTYLSLSTSCTAAKILSNCLTSTLKKTHLSKPQIPTLLRMILCNCLP